MMRLTYINHFCAMVAAAGLITSGQAATSIDPVVQAIRESAQDTSRLSACVLLARANTSSGSDANKGRRAAIELVSHKLQSNDPSMLRARADAARKGLYGFKQDDALALSLYERTRSAESGWNAALMLYRAAPIPMDSATARRILEILNRSGAAAPNSRGSVGAQAHYVAGLINESGATGQADQRKAFLHYRASARNAYVPGAYHYLRMLSQSLDKLPEAERNGVLQELRMMMTRWRWQSADIMLLNGDMYAAKWIPDDDGFLAQYHWRMAKRMGNSREISNFDDELATRIKKQTPDKEKRLDDAVEAGLRNVMIIKHDLEFAELCAE